MSGKINGGENDPYFERGQRYAKLVKNGKYDEAQKILTEEGFSEGGTIFTFKSDGSPLFNLNAGTKSFVNGIFGKRKELSYEDMMEISKGAGVVAPTNDPTRIGKLSRWNSTPAEKLDETFAKRFDFNGDGKFDKPEVAAYFTFLDGYDTGNNIEDRFNGKLEQDNIYAPKSLVDKSDSPNDPMKDKFKHGLDDRKYSNGAHLYTVLDVRQKVYEQIKDEKF